MTPEQIVTLARAQIGTPFRHQGRIAGKAFDCAGLVIYVAKKLGVEHFDVSAYGRTPNNGMLIEILDKQPCVYRINGTPKAGDILLMRFHNEPQHLAICAGETIIHSYMNVAKVCEHRYSDVWKARTVAAYRFNGVSHE